MVPEDVFGSVFVTVEDEVFPGSWRTACTRSYPPQAISVTIQISGATLNPSCSGG